MRKAEQTPERREQKYFTISGGLTFLRSRVNAVPRMFMEKPIEIDTYTLSGIDAILQTALDNKMQVPKPILGLLPSPEICPDVRGDGSRHK